MKQSTGTALVVTSEYCDKEGIEFFVPKDTVCVVSHLYGVYSKRGRTHEKEMEHGKTTTARKRALAALKKQNVEMCNIMRGWFPQFVSASDKQIRRITWDLFEDQAFDDAAIYWKKNGANILSDMKQLVSAL